MGSRYVRIFQQFGNVGSFGGLWNRGACHPSINSNLNNLSFIKRNIIAINIYNSHLRAAPIGSQKLLFSQIADVSCRYFSSENRKDNNDGCVKGTIEGPDITSTNSSQGRPPVSHQDCPFEPHPFPSVTKSEDVCTPGAGAGAGSRSESGSSSSTASGSVSGIGTTETSGAATSSGATPTSGFCAGISPPSSKKESSSASTSSSSGSAHMPDVKLPDRKQVEKTFFRVLAYIYDFSALVINWIRKVVCRYIILNPTIQQHWNNLRAKMEAAKKA